jgi:hypothetical protein
MQSIIQKAMRELPSFGITNQGTHSGRNLEKAFQEALHSKLRDLTCNDGWEWRREVQHDTFALGGDRIMVDIVGCRDDACVAIELKYVTHTKVVDGQTKPPSNPPAFSYDVVKDCAKLEILQEPGVALMKNEELLWDAGGVQGFVIARTNWPRYWGGEKGPHRGWSNNFSRLLARSDDPVHLPGENNSRIIRTSGGNADRTIYGDGGKRCHIGLAQDWQGKWYDFGPKGGPPSSFRYLLLANKPSEGQLTYDHKGTSSPDTFPFLTRADCDAFHREAARVRHTFSGRQKRKTDKTS